MFLDREDAAMQLAQKLGDYRHCNALVLAIPRGAIPMAKIIADQLGGELDVVLVRKLRAPHQPELAIGAIDETGWTHIAAHARTAGISPPYLAAEIEHQLQTIRQRRAQYTPAKPPIDPAGRTVIVVDDGLATGETMIAALHSVRQHRPKQLVCAVPLAPADTLEKVRALADRVVCLEVPADFQGVGQFYRHFPQLQDEEVLSLLRQGVKKATLAGGGGEGA